jgi:hypothetical protein
VVELHDRLVEGFERCDQIVELRKFWAKPRAGVKAPAPEPEDAA